MFDSKIETKNYFIDFASPMCALLALVLRGFQGFEAKENDDGREFFPLNMKVVVSLGYPNQNVRTSKVHTQKKAGDTYKHLC